MSKERVAVDSSKELVEPDASDLGDDATDAESTEAPESASNSVDTDDTPRHTSAISHGALFDIRGGNLVNPLTLVLVRHGVTDKTITHELSGSTKPGPHLNAMGEAQAKRAAEAVCRMGRDRWKRVPPVSRIIASPMTRTQQTAAAIGSRLDLPVESDARLKEIDFGQWEGLTGHQIAEEYGDAIHRWRFGEIAAPGGESIPRVGLRMDGLVRELAWMHAERCRGGDDVHRSYVLASHAVAIKSLVGLSMRMDARSWGAIWPQPASITILELRVTTDGEIAERHLLCLGETTD
jgi:probable phosphoglycerate mutase